VQIQPTSQGYLAAGQQKLDELRLWFVTFLEQKERELLERTQASGAGQAGSNADLTDWLGHR
jgi:hypothetical protein